MVAVTRAARRVSRAAESSPPFATIMGALETGDARELNLSKTPGNFAVGPNSGYGFTGRGSHRLCTQDAEALISSFCR